MKKKFTFSIGLLILLLIQISCDNNGNNNHLTTGPIGKKGDTIKIKDTITAFNKTLVSGTYVFKTPVGNYILFSVSDEKDSIFENQGGSNLKAAVKTNASCDGPDFDGIYRKKVKYAPSKKAVENIADPAKFFTDLSKSQDQMCNDRDKLPDTKRATTEDRNVQFKTVYLYTFKRQPDEDYHVIFGTTNDIKTAKFFNGEISGLSPNGTYGHALVQKARTDFESYFGIGDQCRTDYYKNDFRKHAIKVQLTGSLFYDGEHCTHYQDNGPQKWTEMEIRVAWEIHPITGIIFLE